jgi:Tfp pilus assembly protein PilN
MALPKAGLERWTMADSGRPGLSQSGAFARLAEAVGEFSDAATDGWRVLTRTLDQPEPRAELLIEIGLGALSVIDCSTPSAPRVIAEATSGAAAEIAGRAASIVARQGIDPAEVGLAFADDIVIESELSLPKAPSRLLEQAIGAHVREAQPYAEADGLAFWRVERSGRETARVVIAMIPARPVNALRLALAEVGLAPTIAVSRAKAGGFAARPAWLVEDGLAPRRSTATKVPRGVRLLIIAAGIVVGSALANLALTTVRSVTLAAAAEDAIAAERRATASGAESAFVAARQREALLRISVLEGLAAKLPDGTWFDRIDLKDDKYEIVGFSPSAAETLRIVATVPGVRSAELMSAVTRDQTRNIERFRMAIQIGAGGTAAAGLGASSNTVRATP